MCGLAAPRRSTAQIRKTAARVLGSVQSASMPSRCSALFMLWYGHIGMAERARLIADPIDR